MFLYVINFISYIAFLVPLFFFSKARLLTAILNVFSFDSVFFFFILGNMTNSANYNVNMSSREGHHL